MPRTKSAFIIDDNEMLVRMYRSIFSALNCSVAHAPTSTAALGQLDSKTLDLIVMDEHLVDAFGVDQMRAICAHGHLNDTPIIATRLTRSSIAEPKLRALGVSLFVTKPLHVGSFSALAQRCLDSRAS